jgi:hypothetical protein
MPSDARARFATSLMTDHGIQCWFSKTIYICDCRKPGSLEKIPDLTFVLDGTSYVLPRKNYVMYSKGYCGLEIMSHPQI